MFTRGHISGAHVHGRLRPRLRCSLSTPCSIYGRRPTVVQFGVCASPFAQGCVGKVPDSELQAGDAISATTASGRQRVAASELPQPLEQQQTSPLLLRQHRGDNGWRHPSCHSFWNNSRHRHCCYNSIGGDNGWRHPSCHSFWNNSRHRQAGDHLIQSDALCDAQSSRSIAQADGDSIRCDTVRSAVWPFSR
jgi:hypothetical protein